MWFTIGSMDTPSAPQQTSSNDFQPPKEHPHRILLVEDDDALANVYITRLKGEGFDVRRVANGEGPRERHDHRTGTTNSGASCSPVSSMASSRVP